jgi:perosamine synthetase
MSRTGLGLMPSLTLASLRVPAARALPFPLDDAGCTVHRSARHAVWHGVRALGLGRGDLVLVPALHQGPDVDALLGAGAACAFYESGDALDPDEESLEALVASGARALYLIHHLGFPQDGERWRAWSAAHGLLLIEDCSQAWLASRAGRPVGSWGDAAIFSLPATLPVPDGGALVTHSPRAGPGGARPLGLLALARRTRETWSALGDPDAPASAATRLLLPLFADPDIAARRRGHYELLLDELRDLVPAPFAELPPGASPLAFPVECADRTALLDRLRRAGFGAAALWPEPHPRLAAERFPRAAARRRCCIALPVHQDASPDRLERLACIAGGRAGSSTRLRLEPLRDLDDLGDEWDELALAARNVFATREFLSTWSRHHLREQRVLATACRAPDGRLVAILPLHASKEHGLHVLRFLGYGPGDQLGPICAPSDRIAAARALRRFLGEHAPRWDLFLGHQLPGGQAWDALTGARLLRHEASPVVHLRGARWDDFLGSLGSGLRQEIRYDARRLAREHDVRYRLADDAERLAADLGALFELHAAQWRERSGFSRWEAFHRDLAVQALARGWLRLWLLEVDGRVVAVKYNFRYAGDEFSYQAARDLSWRRVSLGLVLLAHAMRSAMEEGVERYRLLRGAEAYKFRFPVEDRGLDTVALARGTLRDAALILGHDLRQIPALAPARRWIGARLRSG